MIPKLLVIIGLMNIPPDEIPYFVGVFLFILFVREGMGCSRYDPEFFGFRLCFIDGKSNPVGTYVSLSP